VRSGLRSPHAGRRGLHRVAGKPCERANPCVSRKADRGGDRRAPNNAPGIIRWTGPLDNSPHAALGLSPIPEVPANFAARESHVAVPLAAPLVWMDGFDHDAPKGFSLCHNHVPLDSLQRPIARILRTS
jgi:hypothetical protein